MGNQGSAIKQSPKVEIQFLMAAFVTSKTLTQQSPNIVFLLTDDQDQLLGGSFPAQNGATPMWRTRQGLQAAGAMATNFFVHTPICCPSRAETLTGRYLHNVKLPIVPSSGQPQCTDGYVGHDNAGNACCMHVDEGLVNNRTFARQLQSAGYLVGMFGKYLNVCPAYPPPGWDVWCARANALAYGSSRLVRPPPTWPPTQVCQRRLNLLCPLLQRSQRARPARWAHAVQFHPVLHGSDRKLQRRVHPFCRCDASTRTPAVLHPRDRAGS